jgi:hypothetical protein
MSDSTSKMLLVAVVGTAEVEVVVVVVDPDAKVVIDPDAEGGDGGGRISSIAETMPFTAFFIRPVIITKGLQSSA